MDKENTNLFLIENRATLKAFFHPLRARIMEIVATQPLTVKAIAARLDTEPGKLYYHVNLLEKHGLLRVVETRQVANMTEKTYQAVSDQLDIAPALLATTTPKGKDALYGMITSTLDATRLDMLRSLQTRYRQLDNGAAQHSREVIINRDVRFITDARAAEFTERLKALLEEFVDAEVPPATPDAMHYGMALAFYPSFFDKDSEQNE
jgi:DNA-binding transcriptional ArsR family regulator